MSGYKRVNFYDLCRLCATYQQREKTHIFEEKGRKIQLKDKIQTCLSLQVCENDFLPKVICSKCLENLEKSCIFRQECYTSETMLVSYFNNFRHTEEFKKSGKVYIKDISPKTVETDVEVDLSLPPAVSMATTSTNTDGCINFIPNIAPQEMMSSFYTLQIPQPPTPVIQQTAPIVTSNPLIQVHENQKVVPQPIIYNNNKVIPGLLKNNVGAISIRVNANGEIISTTPLIDINSYVNQQKVAQRKILDNPIIKIDLTEDEPDDIPSATSNQPIVYDHIQQNFNRATNINNMNVISVPYNSVMVNSHSVEEESPPSTPSPQPIDNPNPLQLPDVFTPPPSQPQIDNLIPTTVKVEYNTPHVDSRESEKLKLFSCSICSKNFKKREHLCQHVKLHSGFRPYKCENCNKSYIRKEHLMRHLTAHNGEKKFMCEICKRSFSRHDNLLKHKKTHGRVNFTCEICHRKFMLEHFFIAHKTAHQKCEMPFLQGV